MIIALVMGILVGSCAMWFGITKGWIKSGKK